MKHYTRYIACAECVVYTIPLKCRKQYVSQTSWCLNDRLREHNNNVHQINSGHFALHCSTCDIENCKPLFDQTQVVGRSGSQLTHKIIEANDIASLGTQWCKCAICCTDGKTA